jgi:hypothetical protein
MSESENVPLSSSTAQSTPSEKPKKVHAQTQHGREETADEENIVVLAQSFSPQRESSEEVVWREEIYETEGDDDVSSSFLFIYKNISNFQLSSERRKIAFSC